MNRVIFAVLISIVSVSISLLHSPASGAETNSNSQIMFIIDASNSMNDTDDGGISRLQRAKDALNKTLASLTETVNVGVRVYGNNVPLSNKDRGCQDSSLLQAEAANTTANRSSLAAKLSSVRGKGWTPIGKSLQDASKDFTGSGPKTIILLSDGINTCEPLDVCQVAKQLTEGNFKVKIDTLGLTVDTAAKDQLQCVAQNGGGNYYDVNDLSRLQKALTAVAQSAATPPSAEGIPIRGSNKIVDSPAVLSNTLYSDTLTLPETLYYSFDALPKQKITVTMTANDYQNKLDAFNFLNVYTYSKLNGTNLAGTGIFGGSTRFEKGPDSVSVSFVVDTAKQGIAKPQPIAFSASLRSTSVLDGTKIPLTIKVTTEGGERPMNKSVVDSASSSTKSTPTMLPWILFILLLVTVGIAVTALIIVRNRRSKKMRSLS